MKFFKSIQEYWKSDKWRTSLSTRLSVFIMGVTMTLFAMTIGICVFYTKNATTHYRIGVVENQIDEVIESVNNNLNGLEETINSTSKYASFYTDSREKCYEFCKQIVLSDSNICAATIMFRPDYFKDDITAKGHHLFCPTARLMKNGEFHIDNIVKDKDEEFLYHMEDSNWINTNKYKTGYWCEPYYDAYNANELLVCYSYPLFDKEGEIYAVLCADVPLDWVSKKMERIKPTPSSRITVVSKAGHFLVHPVKAFVEPAQGNILSLSLRTAKFSNNSLPELYEDILKGTRGRDSILTSMSYSIGENKDTIEPAYVYYAPIPQTGWVVCTMTPFDDINVVADNLANTLLIFAFIGFLLMVGALFYMVRRMVEPYKKFASVDADIKTAAKIQMAMIPTTFPSLSQLKGTDLFASINPAKSVGGDLYDFLIKGDNLFYVIGDVSGKGVPASLFMAQTRTLFRVMAEHSNSPSEIMSNINNKLSENNDLNMFVTLIVCNLNLTTGELLFCNGGHNAPVYIHEGKPEFLTVKTNIPVGIMEGMPYIEEKMTLQPGDTLFIYTDGVTEAEDVNAKLYGDARLLSLLTEATTTSDTITAQSISDLVVSDVRKHALNAEQSDDITIMTIRFQA